MSKALDYNGRQLQKGDRVMCMVSSIRLIPICIHEHRKPRMIPEKRRGKYEITEHDTEDTARMKKFNSMVTGCRLHLDRVVGKLSDPTGELRVRTLTVDHVSGAYVHFENRVDIPWRKRLLHYHPAERFKKLRDHGRQDK